MSGPWRQLPWGSLPAEAERLLRRLLERRQKGAWWSGVLSSKEQEIEKAPAVASAPAQAEGEAPAAPPPPPEPAASGPWAELSRLSLQSVLQGLKLRTDLSRGKLAPPQPPLVTKSGLQSRTQYLVRALAEAQSAEASARRAEDLLQHVYAYPHARDLAIKAGAVRALFLAEGRAAAQGAAREALSALGVRPPPRHRAPNVLALDGGGVRGLVALHALRRLEREAGAPAHLLFDLVVGVSTGAVVAALVARARGLDGAADAYRRLSREMFEGVSAVRGGARLVWSHGYYDTAAWERLLRARLGEARLGEVARGDGPALAVVSCAGGGAHLFRSWGGGACAPLWHAVRASAAAPTYFDEFAADGLVHQDGGIACNNPAGLALREARALWGREEAARAVLVSLGTGRAPPAPRAAAASTGWRDKFERILESATDTEGTHALLADLLPPARYFRFNPPLARPCSMDQTDPAELQALEDAAAAYSRRNADKFLRAAKQLTRRRPLLSRLRDYARRQAVLRGYRDTPSG